MIGVDEVGRGSWAGPLLVVAARQIAPLPPGLTDSKQLSSEQRQFYFLQLPKVCHFGEGWVSAGDVDKFGLRKAMLKATAAALISIKAQECEKIIFDGKVNYCLPFYRRVRCVVAADKSEPLVAAASIYAKVARDAYMHKLAIKYPNYGFEKHVGYGTQKHIEAIKKWGVLNNIHRRSYKPLRQL